jgi:hypothetical protein
LRTSVTELRQTAEALLQTVIIHQQNFERLTTEVNADRQEWKQQIDRLTTEVNADRQEWKQQIDRIWQYILQRLGENES